MFAISSRPTVDRNVAAESAVGRNMIRWQGHRLIKRGSIKQSLATAPCCSPATHPAQVIGIARRSLVALLCIGPSGHGSRRGSRPNDPASLGGEVWQTAFRPNGD